MLVYYQLDPQVQISVNVQSNTTISIHGNTFENIVRQVAVILTRPQCVSDHRCKNTRTTYNHCKLCSPACNERDGIMFPTNTLLESMLLISCIVSMLTDRALCKWLALLMSHVMHGDVIICLLGNIFTMINIWNQLSYYHVDLGKPSK